MGFRKEKDSLGFVEVPDSALWGAQTQRAIDNFPISGRRFPRQFIAALAHLKRACAEVNLKLKRLEPQVVQAIIDASDAVASGRHDDQFPLDVFQTGSGTSTNMNMNEVVANLASEKLGGKRGEYKSVHPNNHVNKGQSSNDIIPTTCHLSALLAWNQDLKPALQKLQKSLAAKAKEFDKVIKLGRTHLMDAMPVRLGQPFGGYARQIVKGIEQIDRAAAGLHELAIGGTAVGTGINSHPKFASMVCEILAKRLKIEVREAEDHFEAQGARDDMVMVSGALKGLACSFMKIANDIRWMGSGPLGGFAELQIPDLQPGSSIMPGKVNPVMSEVMTQVAAQVIGNDAAIAIGGQGGAFELNVMIPVMVDNLLSSMSLMANTAKVFAEKCVDGLAANEERCEELAQKSLSLATVLNPLIGYEKAAELVKEAFKKKVGVKQLALEKKLITPEQAEKAFDLRKMTEPGETVGGGGG